MQRQQFGKKVFKYISTSTLALSMAISLPGCHKKVKPHFSNGISHRLDSKLPISKMSHIEIENLSISVGKDYIQDPNNKTKGFRFSSLLQAIGKMDQSLAVMRRLAIAHPQDRQVLSEYGKALAAAGQLDLALETVQRAQTPEYPDWRLLSAEASIMDQMNQKEKARKLYKKALELKPNHPSILSNLGVSYLLSGNLDTAEIYLRKAAQSPNASSQVRQNLALAAALKGEFKEAKNLISRELPPKQAEENISLLRSMLTQENRWDQIKKEEQEQEKKY